MWYQTSHLSHAIIGVPSSGWAHVGHMYTSTGAAPLTRDETVEEEAEEEEEAVRPTVASGEGEEEYRSWNRKVRYNPYITTRPCTCLYILYTVYNIIAVNFDSVLCDKMNVVATCWCSIKSACKPHVMMAPWNSTLCSSLLGWPWLKSQVLQIAQDCSWRCLPEALSPASTHVHL